MIKLMQGIKQTTDVIKPAQTRRFFWVLIIIVSLPCVGHSQPGKKKEPSAPIAGNLYADILMAERDRWQARVNTNKNSVPFNTKLAEASYRLAMYSGSLLQVQQAITYITTAITEIQPLEERVNKLSLARLLRSRASMRMTLHRFSLAQNDIAQAELLGMQDQQLNGLKGDLEWNLGHYDSAIKRIRDEAAVTPTLQSLTRLAVLEGKLGNDKASQAAFENAEKLDSLLTPIHTAWLKVQRGIQALTVEDYALAEQYFVAALTGMPNYILALEHLAEAVASQGRFEEAIQLYLAVLENSDNPEFKAALASVYKSNNQPNKARQLMNTAALELEVLIKEYPEAMYQHAAGFYISYGDVQTAIELLKMNASLRPNSKSYVHLADALYDAGRHVEAKKLLLKALKMPPESQLLCELANAVNISSKQLNTLKPSCVKLLSKTRVFQ